MNNEGYIKDYRKKLTWEWFTDPFTAHFFEYCCLKAQYEDASYRGTPIKRGSFTASLNAMSVESGLSVQSVRTAIKHLTSTNDIICQTTNEFTMITICKYNDYQADSTSPNKQDNTPANTPANKPANNYQRNIRREEEINNIPPYNPPTVEKTKQPSAKRFTPPTVDEVRTYCAEKNYNIDPEAFVAFYESKGWMVGKNMMKSWTAAIVTWVKRNHITQPAAALKPQPSIPLGPDEYLRPDGSRTYGNGTVTIPAGAPPRPNSRSYWSSTDNAWQM